MCSYNVKFFWTLYLVFLSSVFNFDLVTGTIGGILEAWALILFALDLSLNDAKDRKYPRLAILIGSRPV